MSEPFATCSEAMHFNGKSLVFIFLPWKVTFCNFESYLHINQIYNQMQCYVCVLSFIIIFFVDLQRDITNMYKEPPPGLHIAADEDDITKVCYLIKILK